MNHLHKGSCYGELNTLESGHYEQISQTLSHLKATMMVLIINFTGYWFVRCPTHCGGIACIGHRLEVMEATQHTVDSDINWKEPGSIIQQAPYL